MTEFYRNQGVYVFASKVWQKKRSVPGNFCRLERYTEPSNNHQLVPAALVTWQGEVDTHIETQWCWQVHVIAQMNLNRAKIFNLRGPRRFSRLRQQSTWTFAPSLKSNSAREPYIQPDRIPKTQEWLCGQSWAPEWQKLHSVETPTPSQTVKSFLTRNLLVFWIPTFTGYFTSTQALNGQPDRDTVTGGDKAKDNEKTFEVVPYTLGSSRTLEERRKYI